MGFRVFPVVLGVLSACSQAPPPIVGVWDRGQTRYAAFLASGEIYDCSRHSAVGTWSVLGAKSFQLVVFDNGRSETAVATVNGDALHIQVAAGDNVGEQADWTRARELGVCG